MKNLVLHFQAFTLRVKNLHKYINQNKIYKNQISINGQILVRIFLKLQMSQLNNNLTNLISIYGPFFLDLQQNN